MEVRDLGKLWRVISITALIAILASGAWAANNVEVVSQTGLAPSAQVEVRVKLTNDLNLRGLYVPLAFRKVGSGPSVTQVQLFWRERLDQSVNVVKDLQLNSIYDSTTGTCKQNKPGGFDDPPLFTDTLSHAVTHMPTGILMGRNSIFSPPLGPGADATGSISIVVTLDAITGCILIDSSCTNTSNHLLYVKTTAPANLTPTFQPGVICIGDCAVSAVDPGSMSPANAAKGIDSVTFTWTAVSGASSYTIQIGFDANLSNLLDEATVLTPKHTYKLPNNNLEVYWRVRANLADQCSSDWTNSFQYTDVQNIAGEVVPKSYSLAQNYPNPFNAGTVIEFSTQTSGHVKLEVFNILGQSVTTLVDDDKPAGIYAVDWDGMDARGNSVPSGIYFYRLSTDHFKEVKKMTLLK